jgi:hypothetical protein
VYPLKLRAGEIGEIYLVSPYFLASASTLLSTVRLSPLYSGLSRWLVLPSWLRWRYVPVPDSGTFCGLPAPSSLIDTAALRAPFAFGWKVTLMAQLFPAATLLSQVFV